MKAYCEGWCSLGNILSHCKIGVDACKYQLQIDGWLRIAAQIKLMDVVWRDVIKAGRWHDHVVVGFKDEIRIRSILYCDMQKYVPGFAISYVIFWLP